MASVLQATDFLKSPAMQQGLTSGFDPAILADGKTTIYVIIPADKLKTHYRWLRLVVTSLMRAVIRKPKKRVTFLLDEFAALGYISEIEVALSTYAGYNVTVWPILQTLVQLENLYGSNWQTFISNCTVRQFFSVNDMFSANYVSEAIGHTSHVQTTRSLFWVKDAQSTERLLITPDELRRESGKRIFMFIADLPPTYTEKLPYYKTEHLNLRADKNPYIKI
jgi:type IV secretion system protein VirD4